MARAISSRNMVIKIRTTLIDQRSTKCRTITLSRRHHKKEPRNKYHGSAAGCHHLCVLPMSVTPGGGEVQLVYNSQNKQPVRNQF